MFGSFWDCIFKLKYSISPKIVCLCLLIKEHFYVLTDVMPEINGQLHNISLRAVISQQIFITVTMATLLPNILFPCLSNRGCGVGELCMRQIALCALIMLKLFAFCPGLLSACRTFCLYRRVQTGYNIMRLWLFFLYFEVYKK